LQLSSLMYERGTSQTLSAIRSTISNSRHPSVNPVHRNGHFRSRSPTLAPALSIDIHSPVLDFEPGALLSSLVGPNATKNIVHLLKGGDSGGSDEAIKQWINKFDVEYAPVSELDAESSAYAALFWDENGKWIVVAFKGKHGFPTGRVIVQNNEPRS
jgi:hypothetical protein